MPVAGLLKRLDRPQYQSPGIRAVDGHAAQPLESLDVQGDLRRLGDVHLGGDQLDGHEGVVVDVERLLRPERPFAGRHRDDAEDTAGSAPAVKR